MPVSIQLIGGPTVVLEIGGLRLLADPVSDAPGMVPSGDRTLTKTTGPAVAAEEIGPIDAVLLSHDQHGDNLDRSGRTLLAHAGVVNSRHITSSADPWCCGTASRATSDPYPAGYGPPNDGRR